MRKLILLASLLIGGMSSVKAQCPAPEIAPWTETFTTTVDPPCWTQSTTTGGPWQYTGNPGYSVSGWLDHTNGVTNNYAWVDFSGTDAGVILTSPEINISALSNIWLEFWETSYYTGALTPYNQLFIEAWDGFAWQLVGMEQGDTGPQWVSHIYDLSPYVYSGNLVQFRFRAESGGAGNDFNNDILIDDVSVFSCPAVSNISGVPGISTVDLNWTNGGTETSWVIEYGVTGFTPGTGTSVVVGTNPYTITGLNPETSYDVYVTADCGGGDFAGATGPYAFTTLPLCPEPTLPNATPGNTDAALDWTPAGTEVMWDVEYGNTGFLLGSGTQAYGVVLGSDTLVTGLTGLTTYDWYVRAVCDVVAPFDTVSLWVGPEMFTTGQPCADPSNLDTTMSDPFNAGLIWTPGGLETEWNVQWGETGFPLGGTGSNTVNGITTLPESLTGLMPGTTYDFYVQAVCGASPDSSSMWVGPYTWTQPIFCVDPSAGGFTNLTTTSVDFGWTVNGSETNWTVEYGVNGFTLGTGTSVPSTNDTISVTGLSGGTDYCFYVQANCGSTADSSSAWVGPFCITTPVSCPAPTNLNAINITNTAANLIWQAGGSETMWNIEYGIPGFNPGMGEELGAVPGSTNNPTYVTGLNAAAPYEYYVQADCGAGDLSVWAGPFAFQTLLVNDEPCNAITLTVDGGATLHHNIGGTDNGESAIVPPVGACDDQAAWCTDAIANNPVWFKFVAPASGGAVVSTDNDFTDNAGSRTEIAVYEVGTCNTFGSYTLLAANTDVIPFQTGSEATLCGLTPGAEYYIMLDGWSDVGAWTPVFGFQGNFGIEVISLESGVSAGTAMPATVCEGTATSLDLFTAISGNTGTNGQWYNPTVAPGNELSNLINLVGTPQGTYPFFYVDGSVCGSDTVETSVTIEAGAVAGGDGSVTSCQNADVVLFNQLAGQAMNGGTWSDDDNAGGLVNGVLYTINVAPGTYNFTYIVTNGSCSDTAVVTVTVDACLSVEEETIVSGIYPNPVEDVLTVSLGDIQGQVTAEILTIQGAVVAAPVVANDNNLEIDMTDVASGVYVLRVMSNGQTQELRIVKQ